MTYFLVIALLFLLVALYLLVFRNRRKMSAGKRSRLNFFFTIGVTLALTVFAVVYNNVILHNVSVVNVYEHSEQEVKTHATELENYLTLAVTTLRVAADSVDIMKKNDRSIEEIYQYVTDQTKIPEEARIIAVADAYDAMTSRRSYRNVMPQDKVRSEIENGIGTQFDPRFAKLMLQMIDEDKDYSMCEK